MGWPMCFLLTTSSLAWTLMIVCTSVYITVCAFGSLISDVTCNYVSADGGRDCPSRALAVLYRMFTIFACYVLTYVWDAVSILTTSLGCFFVHRLCFSNNGLNKLPWTSYLHAILRIISRGASGLVADSPCGVWGRGWTTCLPHFKMRFGM